MCWFFEAIRLFFASVLAGFQFMRAIFYLSRLHKPIVTIFGGKQAPENGLAVQQAAEVAGQLVQHKISVLTGGGPGIMEAASCGAQSTALNGTQKYTLGIGACAVNRNFMSRCTRVIKMPYFCMRKWLLMGYSAAFIVFPGGIGTADELFQLLNLMKLQKLPVRPVILIGTVYWRPLLSWIQESGIAQGFIPAECQHLYIVTDDIEKAVAIVRASCAKNGDGCEKKDEKSKK